MKQEETSSNTHLLGPPHTQDCEPVSDTPQALSGGKGGACPSSLHTTPKGPMENVKAIWISLHGFLYGIKWIMFHGRLDYFRNHLLLVGLTQNEETVALRTLTTVGLLSFIMCEQSMNTFKALIVLIIICNTYIHIYILMGIIRIYILQGLYCFNMYIRPLKFSLGLQCYEWNSLT